MEIKCYTDGSCVNGIYKGKNKKLGAGGWAYKIIIDNEENYITYGKQSKTTSILMEIEAIKQLLLHLNNLKNDFNDVQIIILSDCQSVVNVINNIINEEKIKLKAKTRKVYDEIINLINSIGLKISLEWIKGHSSKDSPEYSIHNNVVDKLARKTARMLTHEVNRSNNKPKKKNKSNNIDARRILTKQPIDMEKYVQYNKLIIPHVMANSRPKESKILKKYNKYKENNGVEKAIEVEQRGNKYIIVDGYISYLWLREKEEYWIPINIV